MRSDTKSACLALVFLGLMTLGDSVTDSLLPALADDAHTQSGRWNLGTAALVLKGVSGELGASCLASDISSEMWLITDIKHRYYRPICDWLFSQHQV